MELIIGGQAQGKLGYVLKSRGIASEDVCDGESCELNADLRGKKLIYKLHLLVRRLLEENGDPEGFIARVLDNNPDVILVTDEIGYGIVPVDAFEREWRERTGRICCELAGRATRVERVLAGLPTVLKE